MRKKILVLTVILLLMALGLGGWYWYTQTEDYQSDKLLKDWETAYRNDTYGGETPEETMALFVSALKKGDTELASKYFLVEDWGKWKIEFDRIFEESKVDSLIKDLSDRKVEEIGQDIARYYMVSSDNQSSPLVLIKLDNGKWKIRTL